MSIIAEKRLYYVDSHNRLDGTHSDFSYRIDTDSKEFDHACVLQMSIPKSYYLVQDGYNTFTLIEDGLQETVLIPVGNYNRSTLRTQVQASLTTASAHGYTYAVSTPPSTSVDNGKYTFTVSGNGFIQPQFAFTTFLNEQLGFDPETTYTFVANTLVSVNVMKIQLEDSLFLHSNMVSNGHDNVLQEVLAVENSDYSNIVYQCHDLEAYAKPIINNANNVYHFYLTDEDDVPIDLNGINLVFTLVLFKKENVYDFIKKYLKLQLIR